MKRTNRSFICIAILLIIAMFLLSGCNEKTPESNNSETTNSSQTSSSSSTDVNKKLSDYSITLVNSHLFRPVNDSKENTYKGDIWWTALFADKYSNLLSDENISTIYENHVEYQKLQENLLSSIEGNIIKAIDYYTTDSSYYDSLTNEAILLCTEKFNPIIGKVKYISSDEQTIICKDYWKKTIREYIDKLLNNRYKIDSSAVNTPVIIREVWEFNDGIHNIEIITANNVVCDEAICGVRTVDKLISSPLIPAGDTHIIYRISVVFVDSVCNMISGSVRTNEEFDINLENNYILEGYNSYQYDNKGTIILSPMYPVEEWYIQDYLHWDSYLFADIDNDTTSELIVLRDYSDSSNANPNIDIYKMDDNKYFKYGSCIEFSNYYFYWP